MPNLCVCSARSWSWASEYLQFDVIDPLVRQSPNCGLLCCPPPKKKLSGCHAFCSIPPGNLGFGDIWGNPHWCGFEMVRPEERWVQCRIVHPDGFSVVLNPALALDCKNHDKHTFRVCSQNLWLLSPADCQNNHFDLRTKMTIKCHLMSRWQSNVILMSFWQSNNHFDIYFWVYWLFLLLAFDVIKCSGHLKKKEKLSFYLTSFDM